ncbi:MAG: ABC transporter ATP-binding protein, partial [Eubacteriales bacterium]|nr:ABC transporter ATP-binding protein [Eubacteriales bacterium]
SGKTTLFNIISGLDKPDSGQVILDGDDLCLMNDTKLTELRRRKVGYIFQFFNLIPEFTVYQNICLPSYLDRTKPDEDFIDEIMAQLDMSDKKDCYPHELSGGEQQRAAIARALSIKPVILLADEPTGNLDIKSGEQFMELLHYCHRKLNQTTLMVTHNFELAHTAERIIVLEDGKIISDYTGEKLL